MGRQIEGYEHWVPPAKLNPDFRKDLTYVSVTSMQQLSDILREGASKKYVAWDLETSSLNPEEGFIVGLSFAFDARVGYYVPINHAPPTVCLGRKALAVFYRFMCSMRQTFGFNIRFDMRFYEFESKRCIEDIKAKHHDPETENKLIAQYTWDMSRVKVFDVQDSVWLADTNKKMPSLKWAEEHFLGWPVTKFEEALGDNSNFYYVDLPTATEYAGQDAIGTYALAQVTMKFFVEAKQAGKIDMQMLLPLMRWENEPQQLDVEMLRNLRQTSFEHLKELEHEIYRIAGNVFKINSSRDLTEVFERLGIDTGTRLKSGYMQIKLPQLENMIKMGNDHPFLKALVEYKKLFKQINSYIDPLLKVAESDRGFARFAYQTCNVPTARLSAGSDKKNSFYSPLNVQCLKEGTLVKTIHGLVPIEEVKDGWEVWNGAYWSECKALGSKKKSTIKVTTGPGCYLCASREHNIYGVRDGVPGWYQLGDLSVGDFLAINRKREFRKDQGLFTSGKDLQTGEMVGLGPRQSQRFWYSVGVILPALNRVSNTYSRFSTIIPGNLYKTVKKGLQELGFADSVEVLDFKGNMAELEIESAPLCSIFSHIGLVMPLIQLPEAVNTLGTLQMDAFIKGLMWGQKEAVLPIKVAEDLMKLLLWEGSFANIEEYDADHKKVTLVKATKVPQALVPDIANQFHGEDGRPKSHALGAFIKAENPKEGGNDRFLLVDDLQRIEEAGYTPAMFGFVEITDIEEEGESTVYDLYVPDTNRFTANGYIVHNSVPKPHPKMWYVREATPEEIANHEDVLGYHFSLTEKSDKWIEGFDPAENPRLAFKCHRDDAYWVSMDMSGEELRIVANLFNETTWLNAFLTGGDIHRQTAEKVFGKENYNKARRKQAKTCFSDDAWFETSIGPVRGRDLRKVPALLSTVQGDKQRYDCFFEERPGYKVTLSNGQVVRVSNGHKFPMGDRREPVFEEVSESFKGRTVVLRGISKFGGYKSFTLEEDRLHKEETFTIDEDLAYVLGLGNGDGHVSLDKRADALTDVAILVQSDNKTKVKAVLERYGNVSEITYPDKDYSTLRVNSRRFARWWESVSGRTTGKHIPEEIFQSPRSVQLNYLAGLLDSDGRVNRMCVTLLGCNERLMRDGAELVAMLGMTGVWGEEHSSCRGKEYTTYKVNILVDNVSREIPLVVGYKREALKARKDSRIAFPILESERPKFGGMEHYAIENLVSGRSKRLSRKTAGLLGDDREHSVPTTIVNVEPCTLTAVRLECATHKYRAEMMDTPNCNFGIIYGMTPSSFHEKHPEMPLEECEQFFRDYKRALPYLFSGQEKMVRLARKAGCVHTVFGRPRRVRFYLNSSDKKKRGFGVRTVNNTVVQGAGGDILRLIFVRVWNSLFPNGTNKYDVRWRNTIHDEVNWSIPEDAIREVLPILVKCMTILVPGWKVPLTCGLDVGRRWGSTFPFKYDIEKGIYIPDWEDVPKEEEQKPVEQDNEVDESLSQTFWGEESPDGEEW